LRWTKDGKQHRRKANTRSWQEAEQVKRELEDELSGKTAERAAKAAERAEQQAKQDASIKLLADAVEKFITDKTTAGLSSSVIGGYRLMLDRLKAYCHGRNLYTVGGLTPDVLTEFVSDWPTLYPSSITRQERRGKLRSFLHYCYEAQWLDRVPAVTKFKVNKAPTLPLTDEEFNHLLANVNVVEANRWDGKTGTSAKTRDRLRAIILLMRYSGLAIRDASTLERNRIVHGEDGVYRVITSRTKTGTHVSVPIPPAVAEEILALENSNPKYLFWTGQGTGQTIANVWTVRYIRPLFDAAQVKCEGHMVSHRLRDTFAVGLLKKGVPTEEVAKLLGNSIRVCEKHYSAWVKERQDRADAGDGFVGHTDTEAQPPAQRLDAANSPDTGRSVSYSERNNSSTQRRTKMAATNRTISNLLSRIMYNHKLMLNNPCETCGKMHTTFKSALLCGATKDDRFKEKSNALVLTALSDALAERDKLRATEDAAQQQ
jgi:integrase